MKTFADFLRENYNNNQGYVSEAGVKVELPPNIDAFADAVIINTDASPIKFKNMDWFDSMRTGAIIELSCRIFNIKEIDLGSFVQECGGLYAKRDNIAKKLGNVTGLKQQACLWLGERIEREGNNLFYIRSRTTVVDFARARVSDYDLRTLTKNLDSIYRNILNVKPDYNNWYVFADGHFEKYRPV